jgi:accessory gene regulator protein AgrB
VQARALPNRHPLFRVKVHKKKKKQKIIETLLFIAIVVSSVTSGGDHAANDRVL